MKKVANIVFNSFVNDSRVLKESESLASNGFEVEVIAHLDKGLLKEEKTNNFKINRFSYLDRKVTKGFLRKLLAYIKFVIKSVKHCKNFDVLHCNDLNTLPIGFLVKNIYKKDIHLVYDAHEYETEVQGLTGKKQKIIRWFEKKMIKYVDSVICVSNSIAEEYMNLYKIDKPYLILNTPTYKVIEKKNLFREKLNIGEDKKIFLYQGGFTKGRGIEILLETFKEIKDKNNVVVFMGYGVLEILIKEYSSKNENIYFYPAVSPNTLLNYTCSADFGILFYENNCLNHNFCSPNKMFEYIMAEVPLLTSNLYEVKRLVELNNIGVVAKENDVDGLSNAILESNMLNKENVMENLRRIKKIYNWDNQEKVLLNLYNNL